MLFFTCNIKKNDVTVIFIIIINISWEEYLYWQIQDKKTLRRVNALLKSIERDGVMKGIGKPEPLTSHALK